LKDSAEIYNLSLVPSGAFLIACSLSMQMRIYSLPSGNQIHVIKPHETPVSAIETDNTSTLVATGGAEGFVKVWDIEGGHNTHIFKGHGGLVSVLKFWGGKESRWRLASGSEDCKIRVWDLVRKRYENSVSGVIVVVLRFWRIIFRLLEAWIFRLMARRW
jgi:U3 small nucleolar RNA-associated protein 13